MNRHAAGTPASMGGQFAPDQHAQSDITLNGQVPVVPIVADTWRDLPDAVGPFVEHDPDAYDSPAWWSRKNLRNSHSAGMAVRAYAESAGTEYDDEPVETPFKDVLADLQHLAAALGLDFDDLLSSARSNFDAERLGEI